MSQFPRVSTGSLISHPRAASRVSMYYPWQQFLAKLDPFLVDDKHELKKYCNLAWKNRFFHFLIYFLEVHVFENVRVKGLVRIREIRKVIDA